MNEYESGMVDLEPTLIVHFNFAEDTSHQMEKLSFQHAKITETYQLKHQSPEKHFLQIVRSPDTTTDVNNNIEIILTSSPTGPSSSIERIK